MKTAPENPYGWTHYDGISDMSDRPILEKQIKSKGIPYTVTTLNMGTLTTENAHIITYTSPNIKQVVSVLVIPMVGADSWCEEYYYFTGLDARAIANMDWYKLFEYMRSKIG